MSEIVIKLPGSLRAFPPDPSAPESAVARNITQNAEFISAFCHLIMLIMFFYRAAYKRRAGGKTRQSREVRESNSFFNVHSFSLRSTL